MWGIGYVVTLFLRDMNWLWGCYTFELCLLWPYRNGSAIEIVSVALAVVGEVVFFAGFLMGNRGEGRPMRDYLVEGVVKMVLGVALSVPYALLVVPRFLAFFGEVSQTMIMVLFFSIGYTVEAVLGVVLVVQGVKCLKRARKAPKIEGRKGRVYYRAK